MTAFTRQVKSNRAALRLLLCLAVALGAATGCGSKGKKGTVSGKVTYKDAPLTGGTITLYPEGKEGAPYPIPINADGSFSASGVPTGKMRVSFETESMKKQAGYQTIKPPRGVKLPEMSKPDLDMPNQGVYVQIPAKYSKPETSGQTCEITTGKQDLKFDLTP